MPKHPNTAWLPLACLVVACASEVTPPIEAPFTIDKSTVFSGGTVTITSATFSQWNDAAILRLGPNDLPLTRIDDSTMQATLPDTLTGAFSPAVVHGVSLYPLSSLTSYGFIDSRALPIEFHSSMVVSLNGTQPGIAGYTRSSGSAFRFTTVDLASGTTNLGSTSLTPPVVGSGGNTTYGPAPTVVDGEFILYNSNGQAQTWRLNGASASFVQTHTSFPPYAEYIQSVHLGNGRWLGFLKRSSMVWDFVGGSLPPINSHGETFYTKMSPRHDRLAVVAGDQPGDSTRVYAVPEGTPVFHVQGMNSTAAEFSPDGQLLVLVGGPARYSDPTGVLKLVDATTGAVVWDTTFSTATRGVTFDPLHPLLYVDLLQANAANSPQIVVIDYQQRRVLGVLSTPASVQAQTCPTSCFFSAMAVSADRSLYLATGIWNYPTTHVYRFQLMP